MRAYSHRVLALSWLLLAAVTATRAGAQTVTVSPSSVSVPVGRDRRLTAFIDGTPSSAVVWKVNGIRGGNAVVGTITANGKYTAPATPPAGWTVSAKAISKANPNAFGKCTITVHYRAPSLTSVSPNPVAVGAFKLRVFGSGFLRGARVLWNGTALPTTFNSSSQLTATGVANEAGMIKLAVTNPGPDAVSAPLSLTVESAATPTATSIPEQTPTMLPTATRRPEPTRTPPPTGTATPLSTSTTAPTATRRVEPTNTAVSTATATPARTSTMIPTATSKPEPTRTKTIAPTGTATPVSTSTTAPTATRRVEPTNTAVPTSTATTARTPTTVPTATSNPEPTRTIAPTGTATPASTSTLAPTATQRVEATNSPTATRRPPRTRTPTPTATIAVAVSVVPGSVTVQTGASQQFQATVTGDSNQAVTWTVNGTAGGDATVGTISGAGLYTAPATVPSPASVTVAAVSVANGAAQGTALVTIQDPLQVTYGRFLDQATFGPTAQLTAHLAQIGIAAFLNEQFATSESPWPPLDTAEMSDVVDAFFANAFAGQDQLRQRVIYALSEIIVESMSKNTNPDMIIPWLQLLSRNAFGNYRTLLKEITLDASMGNYLDLANSGLGGGAANENFPREVMQLFSIGLYQLNLDGSVKVDAQGVPLPTYTQTDVKQLAKALTGWTYGNPTGTPPPYGNWDYYPGPMLPVEAYHDHTAKTILGQQLPAKQTAQQDLDAAINIIFQHPNVGPFLATRLIRALVTSNPSPAYIARVATAFNGTGVRGDMQATIRAVLLDPEARNDTPPANFGRLRTPMQHTIALARALGLDLGPASQFAYLFYDMNEGLLDAPSVFGHYSPSYHIPRSPLFGPEFQIYSPSNAVNRGNFFYWFMYSPWPINPVLQPFVAVAGNAAVLVSAVDQALLYGRMSPATRTALLNALPAMPDDNARVLTAVYLTATSGDYLVQR